MHGSISRLPLPPAMHCVLTADLAALVAQHGPAIIYRREAVPPEAVSEYWAHSRTRFELWNQALARYSRAEKSCQSHEMRIWWHNHLVVLEEVLVTNLLTRVIAALGAGLDQSADDDEISPVTHAIHMSHLETCHRVQQIMLSGRGNSVGDAVRLNRLRQGVERWTDALIGRLWNNHHSCTQYAFNPKRAAEYTEEMRLYGHGPVRETAGWLMNAAMHDMLRRRTSPKTALPKANRRVAQSVLLMLRPDLFDSIGSLKSLWLHRMEVDSERTDRRLGEASGKDVDQTSIAEGLEMIHESYFERWYL